jgi:hypothetical protein
MSGYESKRQPEGERMRMPQLADGFHFVSEDLEMKNHYPAPVARS